MQIVSLGHFRICCHILKCQILFPEKNKKNIINLSSAENAQRVVKVNNGCRLIPELSLILKKKKKKKVMRPVSLTKSILLQTDFNSESFFDKFCVEVLET